MKLTKSTPRLNGQALFVLLLNRFVIMTQLKTSMDEPTN